MGLNIYTEFKFCKRIHLHLPKRNNCISPQEHCTKMVIAALYIMAPKWKEPRCARLCLSQLEVLNSSTGEWVNKLWNIYAMACYSEIKRNKLLINAKTWKNLEMCQAKEARQKRVHRMWVHLWEEQTKLIYDNRNWNSDCL